MAVEAQSFPPSGSIAGTLREGPDFSRETSRRGMTMDFEWLVIMPLSCRIS